MYTLGFRADSQHGIAGSANVMVHACGYLTWLRDAQAGGKTHFWVCRECFWERLVLDSVDWGRNAALRWFWAARRYPTHRGPKSDTKVKGGQTLPLFLSGDVHFSSLGCRLLGLQTRTELYHQLSRSPTCKGQVVGLLGLQNHASQFL